MLYVQVDGNKKPKIISVQQIRKEYQKQGLELSLDQESLENLGVFPLVQDVEPPYNEDTEIVSYGEIYIDEDGLYRRGWEIKQLNRPAVEARVKNKRNEKIKKDVQAISALELELLSPEDKQRMLGYLQALKDIETQPGYPYNIDWPIKPDIDDLLLIKE